MHESWCPLPWLSVEVRNNGDLRMCPHSHRGSGNGLLRKLDGSVYNARSDDIQESRNSALLCEVRKHILDGKWHDACQRCKQDIDAGIPSANHAEAQLWQPWLDVDKARQYTRDDGSLDTAVMPLRHYGLRFGNKCNLKCRSCNPTESDYWYEDYISLWNTDTYDESFGQVKLRRNDRGKLLPDPNRYSWYESESFWQQLHDGSENIVRVHTSGGEPTIILEQYAFLQRCINFGIADRITIEYNSNCTAIPPRAWHMWEHFKEIRIGASIDGIGTVNDYIRYPSDWSEIEQTIDRMDAYDDINFSIWIASTVMIYNVWYLPDLIEWVIKKQFRKIGWLPSRPLIQFHALSGPKHLSVHILPSKVKQEIAARFDIKCKEISALIDDLYQDDRDKRDLLKQGIVRHLRSWQDFMFQPGDTSLITKFWYFTDRLDEIRSQSMRDSLPEFYDVIQKYR